MTDYREEWYQLMFDRSVEFEDSDDDDYIYDPFVEINQPTTPVRRHPHNEQSPLTPESLTPWDRLSDDEWDNLEWIMETISKYKSKINIDYNVLHKKYKEFSHDGKRAMFDVIGLNDSSVLNEMMRRAKREINDDSEGKVLF